MEIVYQNQCSHGNTIHCRPVIQTKEKAMEKYKILALPNPTTPTEHVCHMSLNHSPWWWQTHYRITEHWMLHLEYRVSLLLSTRKIYSPAETRAGAKAQQQQGGEILLVFIHVFSFAFLPPNKKWNNYLIEWTPSPIQNSSSELSANSITLSCMLLNSLCWRKKRGKH